MPYEFFEHEADVGIRGIGSSLEEAFESAAQALFEVMADVKKIEPLKTVEIECEAANVEELFVEWLNKLLSEATINDMLFSRFMVTIEQGNKLTGSAKGEPVSEKHNLKTEVKAATYSQLRVFKKGERFIAECVVDV